MLMLDATTSFRTGRSAMACKSTAVPSEFADVYSSSSYIDCPTPTRAARWTTESTPSSAARTASSLRMSPTRRSTSSFRYGGRPPSPCTWPTSASRARTRSPRASSSSARCEPMKPAPPVMRTVSGVDACRLGEPGSRTKRVGLVRALPRELAVVAAEVAVRRRLGVDRPPQVEVAEDRSGAQIEDLAHELLDPGDRDRLRAERLDEHRQGVRDADRVRNLDLAALRKPGRDDVLRDVPRRVGGRAIDLRRVLAGKRAAAVRSRAAVRVDDDLAPGQAGVAHRAADHELAGRVAVEEVLVLEPLRVVEILREDRLDDVRGEIRLEQRLDVDAFSVLRRDEHALDLNRSPPSVRVLLVAHRHLRLAVRPQIEQIVRLPHS